MIFQHFWQLFILTIGLLSEELITIHVIYLRNNSLMPCSMIHLTQGGIIFVTIFCTERKRGVKCSIANRRWLCFQSERRRASVTKWSK